MPQPAGEQCVHCRYFVTIPGTDDRGQCRRYPPAGLTMPVRINGLWMMQSAPLLVASSFWCGDYRPEGAVSPTDPQATDKLNQQVQGLADKLGQAVQHAKEN